MKVGFIGQGWIGKNYADDFEQRGHQVTRYALEAPYSKNKALIAECSVVFIAVPTPTRNDVVDLSNVKDALSLVGAHTIVVIKSTIPVGTTRKLQAIYPSLVVLHSPEFLREKTAAHDAAHPDRNLIGIPEQTAAYQQAAETVLSLLPKAPYQKIMVSDEAELVKYAGNCFLYTKVLYMNVLYELVNKSGGDWNAVREAMVYDPRIGASHTEPVHKSGHDNSESNGQRGAGGHCFIKDFEAFRTMYKDIVGDEYGETLLAAQSRYNRHLLTASNKDLELLAEVFGDDCQHSK